MTIRNCSGFGCASVTVNETKRAPPTIASAMTGFASTACFFAFASWSCRTWRPPESSRSTFSSATVAMGVTMTLARLCAAAPVVAASRTKRISGGSLTWVRLCSFQDPSMRATSAVAGLGRKTYVRSGAWSAAAAPDAAEPEGNADDQKRHEEWPSPKAHPPMLNRPGPGVAAGRCTGKPYLVERDVPEVRRNRR